MLYLRLILPVLCVGGAMVIIWQPLAALATHAGNGDRAARFVKDHVAKVRPLEVAASRAWWNANVTGKDEDFQEKERTQNRINETLADPKAFGELKAIKEQGGINDPILAREIDVLYLTYLDKQVDPALLKKMVALSNKVEQAFNVFRARVDGKELTDSQVRQVLKESKDSERRRAAWEASKAVGAVVAADLKALVALRNEAAGKLGFKNYHALQLFLNEQNGDDLIKLFDELDGLTQEPFRAAKAEIDAKLAADYNIRVEDLRPWHYHDPFFQESPAVFAVSLDAPYAKADIPRLCATFYRSIGLPIEDVLARSDLYEKKGKSPHAFCTDLDRQADVRVLANIVNNEYWAGTMLHELGHSVYSSKNIPESMPYLLRQESHILTTEGVAMQFERLSKHRGWLERMGLRVEDPKAFDETAAKMLRNQLLIFSRWCQVMLRFEKGMYESPERDLNRLWWDLVERYQGLKRPPDRNAPDYASKIHIVSTPVYYHNYQMGQLFASQVHHAIARELYNGAKPSGIFYAGDKVVGEFMKKRVFEPGKSLSWNELTKHATGEYLNARAFAADFKGD
jgi:peptidyl-dipeptidase A